MPDTLAMVQGCTGPARTLVTMPFSLMLFVFSCPVTSSICGAAQL